jgi:RNA-binding protein
MSAGLMALSGKQRRFLRSLGHHLNPVVQLGKHGITDAVVGAADEAITTHELIKVKRGNECPEPREAVAKTLSEKLSAEIVQELGHTVLLYRQHPKEPQIELPR